MATTPIPLSKEDACNKANRKASNLLKYSPANPKFGGVPLWVFTYQNPHTNIREYSAPQPYDVAVKLRRYYLINAARQLMNRDPFTQAETNEMGGKRWQHFV